MPEERLIPFATGNSGRKSTEPPTTRSFEHRLRAFSSPRHLSHQLLPAALLFLVGFDLMNIQGGEPVHSTGITRVGSDIGVSFEALQGSQYRLERKQDINEPSWHNIPGVGDLTAATNGPAQIMDPGIIDLGKAFYRVNLIGCDAGLPSNASDPRQYAAAMDLCQITTEEGTAPGLISAALTLASGTGTPATVSHSIRSSFGPNNHPRAGASMVVLSTGVAAAAGQINPSYVAFQPGLDTGTSSEIPSDWLAANGGAVPAAPGCPDPISDTALNPVMLTLRARVPNYAHSLRFSAKFFTADFPEFVCSAYNDVFVALLDSTYSGTPANPADKNLAIYIAPSSQRYPVGVGLATGNTGLFTDCVNGNTGCSGSVAGTILTCADTSGLAGTGFDMGAPGKCDSNSLVGGATGWLMIQGNVVPGEIIALRLAIWDTSDGISDSVVLLDNFAWSAETVTPGTTLE